MGRYGHIASNYGEPLNLSIPEQFKPFSPFVLVNLLLHPCTSPTTIFTKILITKILTQFSKPAPYFTKNSNHIQISKLSINTLPDNPRHRLKKKKW